MTDAELVRLCETAEALGVSGAMEAAAARGEEVGVSALGAARLVYAGPGSPLSRVYGFGLDGEVTAADLDRIEAFFDAHDSPSRIELSPHAHPSALGLLRARGYGVEQFKDQLVRSLAPTEDLTPARTVRRVDRADPAAVRAAATAVATGFRDGDPPDESGIRLGIQLVDQPGAATFVVDHDGAPVGGGTVAVAGGRGALFAASTLPDHRRGGIQTALILARLQHARDQGCALATIQAAPGVATRRNAERLGFRLAYTKVSVVRTLTGITAG